MSLSSLLVEAYPLFEKRMEGVASDPIVLFFSMSDGRTRATVCRGVGRSFHLAWKNGVARCQREVKRNNLSVHWLRIDRVVETQITTWGALAKRLSLTKRNYFRLGLSLDADLQYAFLEQELNANAMLYLGADIPEAGLNVKNFSAYAKRRFGEKVELDFSPERSVYLFSHEGVFLAKDPVLTALPQGDAPVWLPGPRSTGIRWRHPESLNASRRSIAKLDADQVFALVDSSAKFLSRQVKASGQFVYGRFPCFGREIPTYNSLRHASTLYSMLEGWELTHDEYLMDAIQRALTYLTETIIRRYPQADGRVLAFNVDVGDEIKLGANAVSLLALVKYDELTGDTRFRSLMDELALGIATMQDADKGSFVHVLNAGDLSLKDDFRTVYYDGEAAFGLMRLYGLTSDPRWLAIVEKAFDHFIRIGHWKHHDHWLSYCANELTLHKPEEKYFRFGVQNVAGLLDFILQRETTYPTLLELSLAFEAMLRRIENEHPEMLHILDGFDIQKFHRALHHRAHYLLNGFFWPELSMYYAKPDTIAGGFFIRHHSFRVRIDDIEHYLSGYVAYWKLLERSAHEGMTLASPKHDSPVRRPVDTCANDVNTVPVCYFCIYRLGETLTGIEHAVLMRIRLFTRYLGNVPHVLSNHLDPWIMERWSNYRDTRGIDPRVKFDNLYDDVLEIAKGSSCESVALPVDAGLQVEDVPSHPRHQRIRGADGKMRSYVVWRNRKGGRLDYINHFSNGRKVRRDRFNRYGQLQISQTLSENGHVLWEACFTPEGRLRLVRHFDPMREAGALTRIELFDDSGLLCTVFDNEQALTSWWLRRRIKTPGNVFVIDRRLQWSRALWALSDQLPQRLFQVMHSSHILPGEDPMTGHLTSRDRQELLSNRSSGEACIVLTEQQRIDIAARFPDGCRLSVIPHAIDGDINEVDFDSRDPDLLVAFVRLAEEKRVEDMLEIMARVVRVLPAKKLHIYGTGPCHAALAAQIERLELDRNVRLMGYVQNVEGILDRACFSMLTSKREGFSLVLLESVAHGCPALAYDVRYGPASVVEHGKNGLLIPDGDIEGGARALIAALSDRELLRRMSKQAYVKARQFAAESVAHKWRELMHLPVSGTQ